MRHHLPALLRRCGLTLLIGHSSIGTAQSLELISTEVAIHRPVKVHLRARGFDADSALPIDPSCIQAQAHQAGSRAHDLKVRAHPNGDDGGEAGTHVTLTGSLPVIEPIVRLHVHLGCGGATLTREFTLLSDAPRSLRPSGRGHPRKRAQTSQTTTPAEAEAIPPPQSSRPATPRIEKTLLDSTPMATPATPGDALAQRLSSLDPWLQELNSIRDDLARQRTETASLMLRIERKERGPWELPGLTLAVAMGLLIGHGAPHVLRHRPRFGRQQAHAVQMSLNTTRHNPNEASDTSTRQHPSESEPQHAILRSPTNLGMVGRHRNSDQDETASTASSHSGAAHPQEMSRPANSADTPSPDRTQWAWADYGEPQLETEPRSAFLKEVDKLSDAGYHGAAVAVLENALHQRPGKSAWILLRLLALYRALQQPQNHERVCAQLEALYNVEAPALSNDHSTTTTDAGLLDLPDTVRLLSQHWNRPEISATLTRLLLGPSGDQDRLSLGAFEDALLLYAVAREVAPPDVSAPEELFA